MPAANIDGSLPVDINRVDIYGYTGAAPPPRERWLEFASLVASIPIATTRMLAEGEIPSGGLALQIGFGAGLVYAAQVIVLP